MSDLFSDQSIDLSIEIADLLGQSNLSPRDQARAAWMVLVAQYRSAQSIVGLTGAEMMEFFAEDAASYQALLLSWSAADSKSKDS